MAVKISSLLEFLSEFKPTSTCKCYHEVRTFRLLNNNLSDLHSDCIYIGKASQLPSIQTTVPTTFLLIKDSDTFAYDSLVPKCDYIYVEPSTDLNMLFNSVQDYFDNAMYVSECALKIMQLNKNTSTLQEVLDLGLELLGNPLLLVDVSLCFIAHAGGNTVINEPLWEWTLSKGYVTEEYVNSVMMDGLADERTYPQKPLLIWEKGILNHDQLVFRILYNNTPVGYLKTLAYNKPISETDQQIITLIGNCLCQFLTNNHAEQASCSPLIESFLISLLNEKLYDRNAINERIHQFNLKLYDNLILIVIELKNDLLQDKDKAFLFKRKLQNFLGRDNIVYYDNHLVALYDYKSNEPFTEFEWTNFENLLHSFNCRAGISLLFNNLYSLPECYRSACEALHTGWKLHFSKPIIKYSDIILQHVFLTYANQKDLSPLIHPAIKTLQELESDKCHMLLETIKAYITNRLEIVPTAKSLFTHYNTIKYRLNRIVELTGLNFTDYQTIFQLQLSFLIMDMLEQLKKTDE
ncbi:PucR family transcriptional regulator [Clostridium autoethanogenum]|uniref:Helix-turn-helix domain-containing protein n=1 Tax=Clostridium autoethanogenum DSM 10061 TaxID=1341692 RepID=A0ABN4BCT9_9CLOT|nr:helix-turn-helix domain-containing protein [Clostridium autoethanogenum]AGY75306.1 helix-turn-helix domain-containing protein [Clostridium autoethanogenum DSM 10061]ALU35472.1 Transcriptional regulator CdaR family [Clostridium autoethanogenum DSM 10061]OVY48569.1 Carbohydrate diacid regulator [Clostridium autoethanogenum]